MDFARLCDVEGLAGISRSLQAIWKYCSLRQVISGLSLPVVRSACQKEIWNWEKCLAGKEADVEMQVSTGRSLSLKISE